MNDFERMTQRRLIPVALDNKSGGQTIALMQEQRKAANNSCFEQQLWPGLLVNVWT